MFFVLALTALALVAAPQTTGAVEVENRLAVVDVSQVFTQYKKVADVQDQVEASFKADKGKLTEMENQLRKKSDFITDLQKSAKPGDEQVFELTIEYQRMEFQYRKALAKLNQDMDDSYRDAMRDVLNEIKAAIRSEATKRGFLVVMRTPDTDDQLGLDSLTKPQAPLDNSEKALKDLIAPKSTFQLLSKFENNPVLYGAQTVDITEPVLKALDTAYQQYKLNKAGAGAPAPTPGPRTPAPR